MRSKKIPIIIIGWLLPILTLAQSDTLIKYSYDQNGNRVSRDIVILDKKNGDNSDSTNHSTDEYAFKLGDMDKEKEDDHLIIKAYPNPTKGIIKLELSKSKEVNYKLFDSNGKLVNTGRFKQQGKLNLHNEQPGIYLLRLNSGKTRKTIKILKK